MIAIGRANHTLSESVFDGIWFISVVVKSLELRRRKDFDYRRMTDDEVTCVSYLIS